MKISFLYKEENIEFIPIIETLAAYINKRDQSIVVNIYTEKNYQNCCEDVVVILTNTFNSFLELYCVTKNKKKVMIFTNNAKESFIRNLLMIVKHISYIRCESVYFKTSDDFKKYLLKNNRRLYNNIINFSKYVERINEIY